MTLLWSKKCLSKDLKIFFYYLGAQQHDHFCHQYAQKSSRFKAVLIWNYLSMNLLLCPPPSQSHGSFFSDWHLIQSHFITWMTEESLRESSHLDLKCSFKSSQACCGISKQTRVLEVFRSAGNIHFLFVAAVCSGRQDKMKNTFLNDVLLIVWRFLFFYQNPKPVLSLYKLEPTFFSQHNIKAFTH